MHHITRISDTSIVQFMLYIYIYLIITWLLCFSPVSTDSSPVSTDSSPISTDTSLLAFLLLEPSPLQSKCTLVNKMCIVLYFEITLFSFIWNTYFLFKKNIYQFWEQIFLWKIKLTPIQGCPRLISMPQAVDCDPQAVTGVSQVLQTACRRGLVK